MRLSSSLILAAIAALVSAEGIPAQTASTDSASASLAGCNWQPVGTLSNLLPRALATAKDGALLLAGDETGTAGRSVMVTMRRASNGAWEVVDRYLPAGAAQTGARALHVDADGNVYALGWEERADRSLLILRRSFGGGHAGTWERAETQWALQPGGALTSDPSGRLYVAYGQAGAQGIGWRVESALRGVGAFRLEDDFRVAGIYGASPQDIERTSNGILFVAGQLDGAPDEWVVRTRPMRGGRAQPWRTVDRYQHSKDSYGLAPRAIVLAEGGALVAGLGVAGAGREDYQWLERRRDSKGRWKTSAFQLTPGRTSLAQDAGARPGLLAVLGVGYTAGGGELVLRESRDNGASWKTVLQVGGVSDPWSPRLLLTATTAAVVAAIEGKAAVIACGG